jgi:hypothetical protein
MRIERCMRRQRTYCSNGNDCGSGNGRAEKAKTSRRHGPAVG